MKYQGKDGYPSLESGSGRDPLLSIRSQIAFRISATARGRGSIVNSLAPGTEWRLE
jgi:hypothetical protein